MPQTRCSTLAMLSALVIAGCSEQRSAQETGGGRRVAASAALASSTAPSARQAAKPLPGAGDFVELVFGEVAGCDLAVDAAFVYFAASAAGRQGGTLARIPKAGGAVENLTPNLTWIDDFALEGDTLFFAETLQGAVSSLTLRDQVVKLIVEKPPGLAPFPGLVGELVASSGKLFWSDSRDLMTTSPASADILWLPGVEAHDAFAADENFVYFGADGDLAKAAHPRASRPASGDYPWPRRPGLRFAVPSRSIRLTTSRNSMPQAIALDEMSVIFTTSKELQLVPKSGGAPAARLVVISDEHFLTQRDQPLALDSAHVYAIVGSYEGSEPNIREGATRIVSARKDGSQVRTLARTPASCGIAADDANLYVATRHIAHGLGTLGSLLRIAKPD